MLNIASNEIVWSSDQRLVAGRTDRGSAGGWFLASRRPSGAGRRIWHASVGTWPPGGMILPGLTYGAPPPILCASPPRYPRGVQCRREPPRSRWHFVSSRAQVFDNNEVILLWLGVWSALSLCNTVRKSVSGAVDKQFWRWMVRGAWLRCAQRRQGDPEGERPSVAAVRL